MKTPIAYAHAVGCLTLLSGLLALISLLLLAIPLADHPEALTNPAQILTIPNVDQSLLRWSMIADMTGYYLLLLPVIFYLKPRLKAQTSWADMITFCATSYVLIGAIGAAILAAVIPPLLTDYASATVGERGQIEIVYQSVIDVVYGGLWNLLETLLAGIWWLLLGYFLTQFGKAFRWTTLVLGAFTLLDGLGNVVALKAVAELGLNGYLVLAPAWAIWLGIRLWQTDRQSLMKAERSCITV
ncbi:hypothetical protein [Spirosoma areae]